MAGSGQRPAARIGAEAINARRLALIWADGAIRPHESGVLVIDETGDRKDGTKTAHVAPQYLGSVGKIANGIVAVTSLWADERVHYPLHVVPYTPAARLPLGKKDPALRTKPQLAVDLVSWPALTALSALCHQRFMKGRYAMGVTVGARPRCVMSVAPLLSLQVRRPPRPPVIVIGMHRSGTSMLAGMLAELGLFIGARTDHNNESPLILALERRLLRQSGGSWQCPQVLHPLLENAATRAMATDYFRVYATVAYTRWAH